MRYRPVRQRESSARQASLDPSAVLRWPCALTEEATHLIQSLRELLAMHVRQRRTEGAPVEQVIAEMKGIVSAAESLEGWTDERETLMAWVIGRSVDAFYNEPSVLVSNDQ